MNICSLVHSFSIGMVSFFTVCSSKTTFSSATGSSSMKALPKLA